MLRSAVEDAVRQLGLAGQRVLVAVSGGVDSTALTRALYELSERYALELSVGHVNHGLRGRESECDQALVAAQARALGLPFATRQVRPQGLREGTSSRTRLTLQEAARTLRYRALRAMAAEQGARVATAHTADDQAETVLLRMLRGCGPDALGGIPECSPDRVVVRPLLAVSRDQVLRYARDRGLRWREDLSNEDPHYARNRLRHRWLPGLAEDFNPQLLRAIGNLAEAARRDAEWVESLVEEVAAERIEMRADAVCIRREGFAELPPALARRLARRALILMGAGRDLSRRHLERVVALLSRGRPGASIELPGGLRLTCEAPLARLHRPGVEPPGAC